MRKNKELGVKSYLTEFMEKHSSFSLFEDAACNKKIGEYSIEYFPFDLNKCWDMHASEDLDYVFFCYGGEAVGDAVGSPVLGYSVAA